MAVEHAMPGLSMSLQICICDLFLGVGGWRQGKLPAFWKLYDASELRGTCRLCWHLAHSESTETVTLETNGNATNMDENLTNNSFH